MSGRTWTASAATCVSASRRSSPAASSAFAQAGVSIVISSASLPILPGAAPWLLVYLRPKGRYVNTPFMPAAIPLGERLSNIGATTVSRDHVGSRRVPSFRVHEQDEI